MLKIRSISNFNGVEALNFIHGFRNLLLYSTSSSTSVSDAGNPGFANYLVKSLGFSKQQALSTSTKLVRDRLGRGAKKVSDFNFLENADSVIEFFKHIGLEHSHIRNAVVTEPQILLCNVDKTLIPKTLALEKLGFCGSDLAQIVTSNPHIYFMGLNTTIVPGIQALREVMGSEHHVVTIMKKSRRMRLSTIRKLMIPNVALLRNYGIPIESIRKCLSREPFCFLRRTELLKDAVIKVEEKLGIPRHSPRFLLGVLLLTSVGEKTVESKRQIFKSFGWTESDVVTLSSLSPFLLALSEANIRKKLGFLMNELGYEPSYLAARCCLFTCSLEKRVMPRHKVLLVLKEKGLIRMNYSLITALSMTDSQFLKKFVLPFKEVHEVYSKHTDISLDMLSVGSSKPNSNAA